MCLLVRTISHCGLGGVILSVIIASCVSVPYEQETKRFRTYLSKVFGVQLTPETSYWLILPGRGCGQCAEEVIERFTKNRDRLPCLHLVTVNLSTYNPELVADIKDTERIHVDYSEALMRLNLGVPVASIVTVQNNRIVEIREIVPENIEAVWAQLKSCP